MALFVNTNISSLNAQRQLLASSIGLNSAFTRLSSGFRINSAADDAAGLQISNRMTSQVNGLNQAVRNANDGISVAQVAEGALQESTNMLQRMRELIIQADNGVNGSAEKSAIQEEIAQLQLELNRVADTTEFSGKKLLNGDIAAGIGFLVGATGSASERISFSVANMRSDAIGGGAEVDGNPVAIANVAAINVNSAQSSQDQLAVLDRAITEVGSQRSRLGAVQNRFNSTISNLSNVVENVSAARSRIMDTDFAAETAKLVRFQIMQQASIAILAQANQRPQAALSLLG
ncbi:MAG: flagellin FliC [Gammaproteobacteria bacterium]|nr:flagellin FliC [Gammaproteobacteria bacterium]